MLLAALLMTVPAFLCSASASAVAACRGRTAPSHQAAQRQGKFSDRPSTWQDEKLGGGRGGMAQRTDCTSLTKKPKPERLIEAAAGQGTAGRLH